MRIIPTTLASPVPCVDRAHLPVMSKGPAPQHPHQCVKAILPEIWVGSMSTYFDEVWKFILILSIYPLFINLPSKVASSPPNVIAENIMTPINMNQDFYYIALYTWYNSYNLLYEALFLRIRTQTLRLRNFPKLKWY